MSKSKQGLGIVIHITPTVKSRKEERMRAHLLVLGSISLPLVQDALPRDTGTTHTALGLLMSITFTETVFHRHAQKPT